MRQSTLLRIPFDLRKSEVFTILLTVRRSIQYIQDTWKHFSNMMQLKRKAPSVKSSINVMNTNYVESKPSHLKFITRCNDILKDLPLIPMMRPANPPRESDDQDFSSEAFLNETNEEAPAWAENGPDGKRLYYDHPSYDILWKTLVELDRPIYLHPRLHKGDFYKNRPWLAASAHGFKTQLASHIVAMCTGGVFDRNPKLQLLCGHMGEGITADIWRLDHKLHRARFPKMPMAHNKLIRDYFSHNIHITTSGHYSTRMMQSCIQEIGSERIQASKNQKTTETLLKTFMLKYLLIVLMLVHAAFSSQLIILTSRHSKIGCDWMDIVPISEVDRLKIGRTNAIKLLRLNEAPWRCDISLSMADLDMGGLEGNVYGIGTY